MIVTYTPEMHEQRPQHADGDVRLSYNGGFYFVTTPLTLKTSRSVKFLETLTTDMLVKAAQYKAGWHRYQVTQTGMKALESQYTFAMACLLS